MSLTCPGKKVLALFLAARPNGPGPKPETVSETSSTHITPSHSLAPRCHFIPFLKSTSAAHLSIVQQEPYVSLSPQLTT